MQPNEANPYLDLDLSVFEHNLSLPRHRWYSFKEGFSERLVLTAIEESRGLGRKLRVLDPFVGSGTTLVAAGKIGVSATGIEVNPFLAFASRAKCTPTIVDKSGLKKRLRRIFNASEDEVPSPLEGVSTFTEAPGREKWLFNRSVLRGYTAIDQGLRQLRATRGPLRLALLASLLECGNAKRDGKCLRYHRNWRSAGYDSSDLRAAFQRKSRNVVEDLTEVLFRHQGLAVVSGDARQELGRLNADSYDLVITSPPYLNSFDYSDVYRPELFLGGFVGDNRDLREIRLRTVRSHVQVGWEASKTVASPMLPPILDQLQNSVLWDRRLPDMVQSYFADMEIVLKRAHRLVRKGGKAWIVVSTSAYGGIEIPVDLILGDIGARQGWRLREINVLRQLRAAGQHWSRSGTTDNFPLRESLIILERGR